MPVVKCRSHGISLHDYKRVMCDPSMSKSCLIRCLDGSLYVSVGELRWAFGFFRNFGKRILSSYWFPNIRLRSFYKLLVCFREGYTEVSKEYLGLFHDAAVFLKLFGYTDCPALVVDVNYCTIVFEIFNLIFLW